MKRRTFLQSLLAGTAGAHAWLSSSPLSLSFNRALAAEGKTLVVVFQRGGCDGLNCIVPYADPRYYVLRPTIGIPAPDPANPESAIDLDGTFGFHPQLAALHPSWVAGNLALLPTVQYDSPSRSHFSSQHFIESGQRENVSDGWLNRHFQTQQFAAQLRAVGISNELVQSLRGNATVTSISNIDTFSLGISEAEQTLLLGHLGDQYASTDDMLPNHRLVNRFGSQVVQDLDVIQYVRSLPYNPDNGAVYPSSSFGRSMTQVAKLIKADVGLEVATVDIGGWDTHSNQGAGQANGSQARALRNLATGVAALSQDLGSRMDNTVILICTEFGRTAHENGSRGTDHGVASTWYVLGNTVQGGIYGSWPGLDEGDLDRGRFLRHTIDYRDIYGDILTQHLENNALEELLPGHTYQPIGLFQPPVV
ncbi:DUF1501 domain-containing protein [Algicola sagamiensis]|uniref:DUF1501 domain-containing protein n=1 Tax=Algicola sagamiensis TaxID=163869 RepID=UPI00038192D6|nr:DUF1501 domain-containing protein [Algicola sagamiensis]